MLILKKSIDIEKSRMADIQLICFQTMISKMDISVNKRLITSYHPMNIKHAQGISREIIFLHQQQKRHATSNGAKAKPEKREENVQEWEQLKGRQFSKANEKVEGNSQ